MGLRYTGLESVSHSLFGIPVEGQFEHLRRSVEGIVDDEKLSVLQTCAIRWVKEDGPIRVLAQEMEALGLQGFELVWIAGSMVLLLFSSAEVRDSVLATTVVWSTWFSHLEVTVQDNVYSIEIQEAELVRIPVVEQPEEESDIEVGDEPHGTSVVSPEGRVGSDGNAVKKARSLDVVVGNVGVSDALTCFGGGCRGVCSADDVRVAWAGIDLGTLWRSSRLQSLLLIGSLPALGVTGAALAPILGSVPGGVCKVKSVNRLVEALASPEQRRSIAAARARRRRGRPGKTCVFAANVRCFSSEWSRLAGEGIGTGNVWDRLR
ncbi:hypothetical protein V6N11_002246 [Hibiscus sabdariffa]|uniref:Uncharacterized protein n=1 Tax=Hibiscus sabdariffa TaxID=183260 RepID=A0ABR2QVG1_9ROSI